MSSMIVMINLFGAVALLLFGLSQVKRGVTAAFGAKLRTGLARGTKSAVRSFVSGFVATIGLQSSTATALMVASFVERDLMRGRRAQVVLLGANVGTAVTAWLVSTGIVWISPLLLLVGMVLYRSGSTARKGGGSALIGIGLMLLSLELLGIATEPMRDSPALAAFLTLLDSAWPVALMFSAVLAVISSSSLAVVVLVLSLASAGILSPALTIVLVLGANLGGAIPPVIATARSSASARRVTLGNLLVRTIGCVLAMPMAGIISDLLNGLPFLNAKLPVDFHLLFNISVAILAWPFSSPLSRLMARLVPDEPKSDNGPRYLDEDTLASPVMALSGATREVLRVGDIIESMLIKTMHAFDRNNLSDIHDISMLEKQVDRLQQDIKIYLSRLGRAGLDEELSQRSMVIIDYAINLEHIGDIIEKGVYDHVTKKVRHGLKFSEDGYQELHKLFDLTIDNLRIAQTILVTRNFDLARQLMQVKVEVRRMERVSAARHLERLRDGRLDSLQTSSLHLDMLRDLKRINAHIVSVAHPILDENGVLTESRVSMPKSG
ncbi:Na/Pi cotransporter family protein [Rhizobium sp. CFBP 8762]|uniref:Na/Pi cotransporter family protein n=1 Tax=Rhizobium sp. CFBP 8762 TaxID=2775279 RepID=UPI00177FB801|nr:Na/Pi cotransporter family protein [Rhizobium sp. CFBP 8762]MBD8555743.1 Na/Pi cotransporter family protein [Rhizobium sp. CFBP 8762]